MKPSIRIGNHYFELNTGEHGNCILCIYRSHEIPEASAHLIGRSHVFKSETELGAALADMLTTPSLLNPVKTEVSHLHEAQDSNNKPEVNLNEEESNSQ